MNEQYTMRVYDKKLVSRIENIYDKCKEMYSSKNPFFVDCMERGIKSFEKDLFGDGKPDSLDGLYGEIHETVKKLDLLLKICEKTAKESLANLSINQKLLSCNYNMLLGLSDNNPCKKNFVESGMYDDLPERLEEILEEVLSHFLKK